MYRITLRKPNGTIHKKGRRCYNTEKAFRKGRRYHHVYWGMSGWGEAEKMVNDNWALLEEWVLPHRLNDNGDVFIDEKDMGLFVLEDNNEEKSNSQKN